MTAQAEYLASSKVRSKCKWRSAKGCKGVQMGALHAKYSAGLHLWLQGSSEGPKAEQVVLWDLEVISKHCPLFVP
jgi:hypothetical protein